MMKGAAFLGGAVFLLSAVFSAAADDPSPWDMPVPSSPEEGEGEVVNVSWDPSGGREVAVSDCGSARDELDREERDLIDVKARFWALKLKEVFYSRLRYWHQEDYVPGLTRDEFGRLKKYQKLLELTANYCGL